MLSYCGRNERLAVKREILNEDDLKVKKTNIPTASRKQLQCFFKVGKSAIGVKAEHKKSPRRMALAGGVRGRGRWQREPETKKHPQLGNSNRDQGYFTWPGS